MPRPISIIISGVDRLTAMLSKTTAGLDKFGKKAKKIGKTLTLGLTLPLLGLGTFAFKAAGEFNQGMAQVATLIPGNVKRVHQLAASVKDLSVTMGRGTADINSGLYQTISAFGDTEETVGRLTIALRASTAGAADTQDTLTMLSGVTKAYGDTSVKALQHVADLAFKTVELGETTFPELAAEMGKVNSLSFALGLSQEEMFGVIAAGTGPLGNTAAVTTKLKGAMISLLKPNSDMEIAFKKLGVASGKQLVAQKGFRGALQAVADVANKYNVSLAKVFGESEALQLAVSLTGAQTEDYTKKLAKLLNVTGALDKAYTEVTSGIDKNGFTLRQFSQMVNLAAIEVGNKLAPALVLTTNKIKPVIKWFLGLNDKTKSWIITIGLAATAIGPIIAGIGLLSSGLSGLITTIRGVATALVFLTTNPIGITITIIGILAFAIYKLIKNWDLVKSFFAKTWNFVSKIFQTKIGIIVAALSPIVGIPLLIAANWEKVVAVFKNALLVGGKLGAKLGGLFHRKDSAELANKMGLTNNTTNTLPSNQALKAVEILTNKSKVESTTNIKIENKADAKIRTRVDQGRVNLETLTGELIPAVG